MATTPEESEYTSIKLRIKYWKNKASADEGDNMQPKSLMPFAGDLRQLMPRGLVFNLVDYIELVEWTGRIIRDGKRGAIPESMPPILQRLEIPADHWLELSTKFEKRFKGIAGSAHSIKQLCAYFGLSRQVNRSSSKTPFG